MVSLDIDGAECKLIIAGVILDPVPSKINELIRLANLQNKNVDLDITDAKYLGFGFFGLLLMLKKQLDKKNLHLKVTRIDPHMKRLFEWNGLAYLIK